MTEQSLTGDFDRRCSHHWKEVQGSDGEAVRCDDCGLIRHITQVSEQARNSKENPFQSSHRVIGNINNYDGAEQDQP